LINKCITKFNYNMQNTLSLINITLMHTCLNILRKYIVLYKLMIASLYGYVIAVSLFFLYTHTCLQHHTLIINMYNNKSKFYIYIIN